MGAGTAEGWIGHHLGYPLAGQGLAHITASDVLLEPGEDLLERRQAVTEQRRIGHTTGIERAEADAGGVVEAAMQLQAGDHVAQLAVFVGLSGLELLTAGHGDRRLESLVKAGEIAQIRWRGDGDLAAQFFGVGRHRAQGDQALIACWGGLEILQQQAGQQEVPQMVGGHAELIALGTPFRFFEQGLVDRGIDHQRRQGPIKAAEHLHKRLHRLEIGEVQRQDDRFRRTAQTHLHQGPLGFGAIPTRHHHGPALIDQGLGGPEAHAR